jgi:predicted RNA binding protein YcfA (HicA-like mRNA interferase family)
LTKLPVLSAREVVSRLRRLCFKEVRQSGSHIRLERASGEALKIPNHPELSRGILKQIVSTLEDRFGYSREEAIEFLKTGKPEKVSCPIEQWTKNC